MKFSIYTVSLVLVLGLCRGFGEQAGRTARIFPEYSGVTIPTNIAPLNFKIEEPGERFQVRIRGAQGAAIEISSSDPGIVIPPKSWSDLLSANAGSNISIEISAQTKLWTTFTPITNSVAHEPIDNYLAYRLIKPIYNAYSTLGIYQRNLATYEEKPILRSEDFKDGCLNCHTFLNQRPDHMSLNIRGQAGSPMLLVQSNEVAKVAKTFGYMSWHPNGQVIAFTANKLSQFFHTVGETRDVFDAQSSLSIYRIADNQVITPPAIARKDRQQTWPCWSPDGKYLYFCSAPVLHLERHREVRYDISRISYDSKTGVWGEVEIVVSAAETGLSCLEPRISPDGRYLLFCMCRYGNFPIYQRSADLFFMDLATRRIEHPDINSLEADTWHCWSSNGRWIVFSSKRRDGLFARPYFSYFSADGHFSKPFMLPQKDPAFYDSFIKTFNVPEFIQGPVQVSESALSSAIYDPHKEVRPHQEAAAAESSDNEPYYSSEKRGEK